MGETAVQELKQPHFHPYNREGSSAGIGETMCSRSMRLVRRITLYLAQQHVIA